MATFSGSVKTNLDIEKLTADARRWMREAVLATAFDIQADAILNLTDSGAVDTGRLRSSVQIETEADGLTAFVGTDLAYGGFIELGTKPHFPPISAIEGWARRHGLNPYLVARAIARKGTKARPWLEPAYEKHVDEFLAQIEQRFGTGLA